MWNRFKNFLLSHQLLWFFLFLFTVAWIALHNPQETVIGTLFYSLFLNTDIYKYSYNFDDILSLFTIIYALIYLSVPLTKIHQHVNRNGLLTNIYKAIFNLLKKQLFWLIMVIPSVLWIASCFFFETIGDLLNSSISLRILTFILMILVGLYVLIYTILLLIKIHKYVNKNGFLTKIYKKLWTFIKNNQPLFFCTTLFSVLIFTFTENLDYLYPSLYILLALFTAIYVLAYLILFSIKIYKTSVKSRYLYKDIFYFKLMWQMIVTSLIAYIILAPLLIHQTALIPAFILWLTYGLPAFLLIPAYAGTRLAETSEKVNENPLTPHLFYTTLGKQLAYTFIISGCIILPVIQIANSSSANTLPNIYHHYSLLIVAVFYMPMLSFMLGYVLKNVVIGIIIAAAISVGLFGTNEKILCTPITFGCLALAAWHITNAIKTKTQHSAFSTLFILLAFVASIFPCRILQVSREVSEQNSVRYILVQPYQKSLVNLYFINHYNTIYSYPKKDDPPNNNALVCPNKQFIMQHDPHSNSRWIPDIILLDNQPAWLCQHQEPGGTMLYAIDNLHKKISAQYNIADCERQRFADNKYFVSMPAIGRHSLYKELKPHGKFGQILIKESPNRPKWGMDTLFRLKYYRSIKLLYKRYLDSFPKDPSLPLYMAEQYYMIGDLDKARKETDKAFAIAPNHASVPIMRFQIYLATGNKKKALEELDKVVALEPKTDFSTLKQEIEKADISDFKRN